MLYLHQKWGPWRGCSCSGDERYTKREYSPHLTLYNIWRKFFMHVMYQYCEFVSNEFWFYETEIKIIFDVRLCTEGEIMVGMWFGEFCSCCCLPLIPQLACSIPATTYKDFFRALYRNQLVSRCIWHARAVCNSGLIIGGDWWFLFIRLASDMLLFAFSIRHGCILSLKKFRLC